LTIKACGLPLIAYNCFVIKYYHSKSKYTSCLLCRLANIDGQDFRIIKRSIKKKYPTSKKGYNFVALTMPLRNS